MNTSLIKNPIIKGTLILSAAGILTRVIGFYYRVYLSNIIGAEGIGLYQMIFPIYGLVYSFSCAGISVAISRYSAIYNANNDYSLLFSFARFSICLSIVLSAVSVVFLNCFSNLFDKRISSLLGLMSVSVIFCSIHSCIFGFFLGIKETKKPAITQLIEQISRVIIVIFASRLLIMQNIIPSVKLAVFGLIIGDFFSAFVSLLFFHAESKKYNTTAVKKRHFHDIFNIAFPISTNRIIQSIMQTFECTLIPLCLVKSGLNNSDAVKLYGVFTGMALPLICFPSSITSSISSVILPSIAEAYALNNTKKLFKTTKLLIVFSVVLGLFFTLFFLVSSSFLGRFLFNNDDVGLFISILSWLCPFLYLCNTMCSILNGLGMTKTTFFHNTLSSVIRLFFIIFLIPEIGIRGLLYGILFSYVFCSVWHIFALYKKLAKMV